MWTALLSPSQRVSLASNLDINARCKVCWVLECNQDETDMP